jgi:hypothetical protein
MGGANVKRDLKRLKNIAMFDLIRGTTMLASEVPLEEPRLLGSQSTSGRNIAELKRIAALSSSRNGLQGCGSRATVPIESNQTRSATACKQTQQAT